MSVAGLATLARVRDDKDPTKGDLGKAPPDTPAAAASTSNSDILSSALPVGLVAAYTTFIAAITGLVDEPTAKVPKPNTFEPYRWIAFVALVVFAVGLVYGRYRSEGGAKRPVAELLVSFIASVGWGLGMPESPLAVSLGKDYSVATPILIAFLALGGTLLITNQSLQKKRT